MCTLYGKIRQLKIKKDMGITAYRLMQLVNPKDSPTGEKLSSVYSHKKKGTILRQYKRSYTYYDLGETYKAHNLTFDPYNRPEKPGEFNGSAGFYAYKTVKNARQERLTNFGRARNIVVVRVKMFGTTTTYMNGYRSSDMSVESIIGGRREWKQF